MSLVTMTSTVGELTSGQTYRVRAKSAERLVAAAKATKAHTVNKFTITKTKEGKRDA